MNAFKRIFFFILLCTGNIAGAQHYNLLKFKNKDGLGGFTINAIIKDSKDYMWLASQDGGVCKYNGKEFVNYSTSNGLHTNDITSLCEDALGNIWIGTKTGVALFDGKKFRRIHDFGLDSLVIYSIYCDKKNNIWIATFGNGLIKYDGKSYTHYRKNNGLPTDSIFTIIQDTDENYWIGTYHFGVCKISSINAESHKLGIQVFKDAIGGSSSVFSLLQDSKGRIWIGSTSAFVYKFENNKISQLFNSVETNTALVGKILEDANGAIWIATQESGLFKFMNNEFKKYSEREGFPSNEIYALGLDHENNLWVGTNGQGLCVFKNESFLNFNKFDGLPHKQISSFFELNKNFILIGTASGLCYYDGLKIRSINNIPEIENQSIHCIAKDKDNNIWLGTDDGIIILRKTSKLEFVKSFPMINNINLGVIYGLVYIDHTMWIATSTEGLFAITGSETKIYTSKNELTNNNIFTITKSSDNSLWIGYLNGGASKYDGKKFVHFNAKNQLANLTIESIVSNKRGQLLFATADKGLVCYDTKIGFKNITQKQGLSSDVIVAAIADAYDPNVVWLSTPKGLNKLKLDSLFNVVSIKHYTEENGLFGNELTENTLMVDSNKNIWIGGAEGFSIFNPSFEKINYTPPTVYLMDIRLFYQKVDWSKYSDLIDDVTDLPKSLKLNYKNNHLTFDFQAISVDKEMKYSYILEGFDKDWSPPGKLNEAIYSNIPSGKDYIFRVKAQNSDGVWSTKNIEFKFTIESPIWQRWWFITLAILFALVGIVFYTNYRTAKLAKEKKLLEDTVASRTVELKETNDQLSDAFKDIKDSINYAQKIQQSILPVDAKVKAALPDSFILFKPRDIVSGDFYWFGSVNVQGVSHHILAAADCTGHGVPGAFMSMVGNTILNEIVITKHIIDPSEILSQLHHGVKTALQQSENESRDGMDICLCSINSKTNEVLYAGAFNPLWILRNSGEMEIIKATKSAIGGFTPDDQVFESHKVQLQKGECIYLFTDGYADQFGGENGKKLTSKKFRDALLANSYKTMKEQGFFLDNYIEIWKGNESQVDDILVIGARV
ncbi:MAG: SpoIIE family protein phosphatase [Bacteroidetes bacterium]|nr:SpoIIE family protein phosphatase [Bacteroidota bacterium]